MLMATAWDVAFPVVRSVAVWLSVPWTAALSREMVTPSLIAPFRAPTSGPSVGCDCRPSRRLVGTTRSACGEIETVIEEALAAPDGATPGSAHADPGVRNSPARVARPAAPATRAPLTPSAPPQLGWAATPAPEPAQPSSPRRIPVAHTCRLCLHSNNVGRVRKLARDCHA